MKLTTKMALAGLTTLCTLGAQAFPANSLLVSSNVTTDTVWTKAQSPIILQAPIFVQDGASLTIEAGVVVVTPADKDGGIVVERDSQIFALGTKDAPIIMTSLADVATWDGTTGVVTGPIPGGEEGETGPINFDTLGDPATGTWRRSAQEWRNLTICGNGIISSYNFKDAATTGAGGGSNPPAPGIANDGANGDARTFAERQMEGLAVVGDEDIFYGGIDDNDDSGSLCFVSIRYAGRVLGAGNELNGLSLGAIGRETDISYVEIMNNVDDGIELWGGTVFVKNFGIWNVGDDSLDFDQGWRGGAQFGLIVQGASFTDQNQGSGIGDNCIEGDGAEDSDAQPRSSVEIRNVTVVGQPLDGDGYLAYRDGLRMQVRRSIFVNGGEHTVRHDNSDGDGGEGYGFNGTQSFVDTWSTLVSADPAEAGTEPNNPVAPFTLAGLYGGALSTAGTGGGMLNEIRDSVIVLGSAFYDFEHSSASGFQLAEEDTTDAIKTIVYGADMKNAVGQSDTVTDDGAAIAYTGFPLAALPSFTGPEEFGGSSKKDIITYTLIDPRPANNALTVDDETLNVSFPSDKFCPAPFKGAFSANHNWMDGWTAADAFEFLPADFTCIEVDADIKLAFTVLSFDTVVGVNYSIQSSTDCKVWTTEATVAGTGDEVVISSVITLDGSKIYRAVPQ